MRGSDEPNWSLVSYVSLEEQVPARHPLPKVRLVVNDALASLDAEFSALYAADGRPSIAPKRLLQACLIQILLKGRRMGRRRHTLGADKGYHAANLVGDLRDMCVTPHVAAKANGSAIDGRTTRHAGYAVSQRKRKQIGEALGWGKTVGQMRKTMLRGLARVGAQFTFNIAGYSLAVSLRRSPQAYPAAAALRPAAAPLARGYWAISPTKMHADNKQSRWWRAVLNKSANTYVIEVAA